MRVLQEYAAWIKIHLKQISEYKVSFYLFLINNFLYGLTQYLIVIFFIFKTHLLPLYQATLVMLTSWLIFDLSKFFTFSEGFYYSDYFLFLSRPVHEWLSTISNVWNRIPIIIIEIALIIYVIKYYMLSIGFKNLVTYIALVILGVATFSLLYNTLEVLGAAIFKSDKHGFRYLIFDVQDVFLKYPYVLFRDHKFIWTIAMVFLVPLYTYNPASMLWMFSFKRFLINAMVGIFIITLLTITFRYTYRTFLKLYEVYGG